MKVILMGCGYIGSRFKAAMERNGDEVIVADRRLCRPTALLRLVKGADLLINAAGFVGKPNVDACELPENRDRCFFANAELPQMVRWVSDESGVPFCHVSTGCLYNGADCRESDPPNHESFYSRSKAIGEVALASGNGWVCRLRMPFDDEPGSRNYLSKLLSYERLITERNSISHTGDFVNACIHLWCQDAARGIYNIVNPDPLTPVEILEILREEGVTRNEPEFISCRDLAGIIAARSNCTLNTDRLARAGIVMRSTEKAIRCAARGFAATGVEVSTGEDRRGRAFG